MPKKFELHACFNGYDLYSKNAPRFHLQGTDTIGTVIGCALTIFTILLITTYTGIRGSMMMTGARPAISAYTMANERSGDELIDLKEKKFKVAFLAESLIESDEEVPLEDPNFIEWNVHFYDRI